MKREGLDWHRKKHCGSNTWESFTSFSDTTRCYFCPDAPIFFFLAYIVKGSLKLLYCSLPQHSIERRKSWSGCTGTAHPVHSMTKRVLWSVQNHLSKCQHLTSLGSYVSAIFQVLLTLYSLAPRFFAIRYSDWICQTENMICFFGRELNLFSTFSLWCQTEACLSWSLQYTQ
jgi:hypothetical protein